MSELGPELEPVLATRFSSLLNVFYKHTCMLVGISRRKSDVAYLFVLVRVRGRASNVRRIDDEKEKKHETADADEQSRINEGEGPIRFDVHSGNYRTCVGGGKKQKQQKNQKFIRTFVYFLFLPMMLPRLVCEFQIPKIKPRFPFPNQLPTTVTTPGQPVVWATPARI